MQCKPNTNGPMSATLDDHTMSITPLDGLVFRFNDPTRRIRGVALMVWAWGSKDQLEAAREYLQAGTVEAATSTSSLGDYQINIYAGGSDTYSGRAAWEAIRKINVEHNRINKWGTFFYPRVGRAAWKEVEDEYRKVVAWDAS